MDQYHYLSKIYDEYIGCDYYQYIRNKFKNISDNLVSGSSHLDIGCGTGNLLEYSDSLGFKAKGIDVSPGMIKVARSKLNSNIDLSCTNFFELVGTSWDIITANNDVINYIAVDYKLTDILNHVSGLLLQNGICYADVVSDYDILENWEYSGHSHTDLKTFRCNVSYHIKEHEPPIGITTRDWSFKKNDKWQKKKSEVEVLRGISTREIIEACESNNLSVNLSEFQNGNIEMVLTKNK